MSDPDFVVQLRKAAEEYIRAVDAWESKYRKFYRLADPTGKTPSDMAEEQAAYDDARKHLALLVPRARGLTFKHGIRDPWTGLLHSSLGQFAPQDRDTSALSRAERSAVHECLIVLAEIYLTPAAPLEPVQAEEKHRGLLGRLRDFFY